jgi:DNA-binding MarR family transcriptional regulator
LSITSDLKQTKPFASKREEAAVTLIRTADLVRRAVGSVVEPQGITSQQYNVLRILRGAGDEGLPTLEIAYRMVEQTPGITRLIDRLEGKQLVSRERSSSDRRCVYCRITPAGLDLLAVLDAPVRHAADGFFQNVNERQLADLVGLLDQLRESLNNKEEVP